MVDVLLQTYYNSFRYILKVHLPRLDAEGSFEILVVLERFTMEEAEEETMIITKREQTSR